MDFNEEDLKNLYNAISQKEVELCLNDVVETIKKYGDLEDEDEIMFKARLETVLKDKVIEIRPSENEVFLETENMIIELVDGKTTARVK